MGEVRYTGERQPLLQPILDGRKDGTRGVTGGRVHMWLFDVRMGPQHPPKGCCLGMCWKSGLRQAVGGGERAQQPSEGLFGLRLPGSSLFS